MSRFTEVNEHYAAPDHEDPITSNAAVERVTMQPKGSASSPGGSSGTTANDAGHGAVEMVSSSDLEQHPPIQTTAADLEERKGGKFAFLKRPQFWIVLALS